MGVRVDRSELVTRYKRFAAEEARGESGRYELLARQVAVNDVVLDFLLTLPVAKRQPNLLLAALQYLGHDARSGADIERVVRESGGALASCMLSRATQTNEPARCAAFLPLLCTLRQPLALLEVGASAGLCLLPDRYRYAYGTALLEPESSAMESPLFRCEATPNTPIPARLPDVVWRAGIDLSPVDLSDASARAWLRALVWPDQPARLRRLEQAIALARADPPHIVRGDLVDRLHEVAAGAPPGATLVVFHTSTLFYVAPARRDEFRAAVAGLPGHWISNEARPVFPEVAVPDGDPRLRSRFVLALDGQAVARTGPHGQSIDWLS